MAGYARRCRCIRGVLRQFDQQPVAVSAPASLRTAIGVHPFGRLNTRHFSGYGLPPPVRQ